VRSESVGLHVVPPWHGEHGFDIAVWMGSDDAPNLMSRSKRRKSGPKRKA